MTAFGTEKDPLASSNCEQKLTANKITPNVPPKFFGIDPKWVCASTLPDRMLGAFGGSSDVVQQLQQALGWNFGVMLCMKGAVISMLFVTWRADLVTAVFTPALLWCYIVYFRGARLCCLVGVGFGRYGDLHVEVEMTKLHLEPL